MSLLSKTESITNKNEYQCEMHWINKFRCLAEILIKLMIICLLLILWSKHGQGSWWSGSKVFIFIAHSIISWSKATITNINSDTRLFQFGYFTITRVMLLNLDPHKFRRRKKNWRRQWRWNTFKIFILFKQHMRSYKPVRPSFGFSSWVYKYFEPCSEIHTTTSMCAMKFGDMWSILFYL